MSSTVLERPAATGDGGAPARRAMVRWAWRLFRREWRQQLLVLALITVAVAATILGAAVAGNLQPPANEGFGTATRLVALPGDDPNLAADLAAVRQRFGVIDVIENQSIATGLTQGAQLRAQDPQGPYGQPMLTLLTGHFPAGAGEVAMTPRLAATFGLHPGDVWDGAGPPRRLVAMVENPLNLLDNFALVAPGQLSSPAEVTVLFNAPERAVAGFRFPAGAAAVAPRRPDGIPPAVIVFAIAIVGLIFVGLVAVAGFTVLAQRRLRGLGMLSSLGASDRDLRLVMVANGAVVGVIGAVAGAVIGLGTWFGYAPHLATSAHHRVRRADLPWWLVAATIVLAIGTAVLASRRPARAVARVPVVAALSGRPAPVKGVHRSAVPGAVALGGGALLLAASGGWGASNGKDTLFQLVGLLGCAVGLLLLAPLTISVLAVNAGRAPIAVRIALRDLARYRARSGAALAATSFAVFIAMAICLIATGRFADPVDYFGPNLPANQLVVYAPGSGPGGGGPDAPPPSRDGQARAAAIAASLGTRDVLALETPGAAVVRIDKLASHGAVYVATPALLAHYGIDPGTIDPGTDLVTSRPGLADMSDLRLVYGFLPPATPEQLDHPKIQTVGLPTDTSDPNLLLTTGAMSRLRQTASPAAWLIQTPEPLTALQINTARRAAAAAGLTVEVKSDAPSLNVVRNDATTAGILVALGVLAMTVGLVRSETAGEMRTLTATGASSRTRRAITAATAAALGLLGAVLGTAVAYVVTVAFFRNELSERMSHTPTVDLLLVLVGLPLVAAAGGWLFGGAQPPAIAHQPLE
ncbi:MAG: putative transport system permease protein [Mycobacteriales bacterium]